MNLNKIPIHAVDLEHIQTRPGNRDKIQAGPLNELAESMTQHGLLQPILVQAGAVADQYILIAGERRLRAATQNNWETIPARVLPENLDEAELSAIRLVENLQRVDLTPWEEGKQFYDHQQKTGCSIEDLADAVGRSKTYIAQRLAIHKLHPELRALVIRDHWPLSHLPLLARVPLDAQQELMAELIENMENGDWSDWRGGKHSPRPPYLYELEEVLDHYHRVLSSAPWKLDDASLVPAAGACKMCPKRLHAQVLLFPDMVSQKNDQCLDPVCWKAKQQALVLVQVEKIKAKKKELVLLKQDEPDDALLERIGTAKVLQSYSTVDCKQNDAGAMMAVHVSGKDMGKQVWVKTMPSYGDTMPSRRQVDQTTGKPKPPTTKERLAALLAKRMCTAVEFWRTVTLPDIKPLLVQLLPMVASVGMRLGKRHRDNDDWKQCAYLRGCITDPTAQQKLISIIWPEVVEVLQDRLKRFTPFEDAAKSLWQEAAYQVAALDATGLFKMCWESAVAEVKMPTALVKEGVADPYGVEAMPSIALPAGKKGKGAA